MATYKEIRGSHITSVASDPPAPINGQMWYNSTTRTVNAPSAIGNTEQWNGTTWTEKSDLNTNRAFVAGGGTYTSAIASGGDQLTGVTEGWNGSAWTNLTSAPNGKPSQGAAGADNEELMIFGGTPPDTSNEYYNGSGWTEINDLNNSVKTGGSAGTYAAALSFAGVTGPNTTTANCEQWNGTCWANVNAVNTARRYPNNYSCGTSTSALLIGGDIPPSTGKTESWNGTCWSETGDMTLARTGSSTGCADNSSGIVSGNGPIVTTVEEFQAPTTSTVTFTTS
jgi:hypothetical protein